MFSKMKDETSEESTSSIIQEFNEMNYLLESLQALVTSFGQLAIGSSVVDFPLRNSNRQDSFYDRLEYPDSIKLTIRQVKFLDNFKYARINAYC